MSRRPNFHGFPASSAALPRVIKHGRSKDFSKGGQTVTIVMITTTPCFISNARRDGGGGGGYWHPRPQLRPCRFSITSRSVWKDYISQVSAHGNFYLCGCIKRFSQI